MARESGLDVDLTGFEQQMELQRSRARENQKFTAPAKGEWEEDASGSHSQFVGYDTLRTSARIRKFKREDSKILLVLDRTPFYPESGGQVGDRGTLSGKGFSIRVENTVKQGDLIVHAGTFVQGDRITESPVEASVEVEERHSTMRNHTATHLLHKALKEVLGSHVNQAGSLVSPERLRFDFTHFEAVSAEKLDGVEQKVNANILANLKVEKFQTSLQKAKEAGATALFGEKYGDQVRVVKVGDISMELCGGTHVDATGEIGYFRIVREEGIAAGVRRIEAVTGKTADAVLRGEKRLIRDLEEALKCPAAELAGRIAALLEEKKELEKKYKKAQQSSIGPEIDALVAKAVTISDFKAVAAKVEASDLDEFKAAGDRLRERLKSGVGVLGAVIDGKVALLAVVTDDLIQSRSLKAGEIVKRAAEIVGGTGGGKPHLALAGGKDPSRLDEALARVPEVIGWLLK